MYIARTLTLTEIQRCNTETTTEYMVAYFKEQNDKNYRALRAVNIMIIVAGLLLLGASIVRGFITGVVDAFTALRSAIAVADLLRYSWSVHNQELQALWWIPPNLILYYANLGVACRARV